MKIWNVTKEQIFNVNFPVIIIQCADFLLFCTFAFVNPIWG